MFARDELVMFAMMRSGHHAIIRWILSGYPESCHINNPPYDGNILTHLDNAWFYSYGQKTTYAGNLDCLLYNYEDFWPSRLSEYENVLHEELKSERKRVVLVIRSPYNLLASRLKAQFPLPHPTEAIKCWKEYAREFLRITTYFTDPILISYDNWFTSSEYRAIISTQLGITPVDAFVNTVASPFGFGSSFDKYSFEGKAQQMKVLDRWSQIREDVRNQFISLFDEEVADYCARLKMDSENLRNPNPAV